MCNSGPYYSKKFLFIRIGLQKNNYQLINDVVFFLSKHLPSLFDGDCSMVVMFSLK